LPGDNCHTFIPVRGRIGALHQIFGRLGAYAGAALFDATGGYDAAFVAMLASAVVCAHADADAAR